MKNLIAKIKKTVNLFSKHKIEYKNSYYVVYWEYVGNEHLGLKCNVVEEVSMTCATKQVLKENEYNKYNPIRIVKVKKYPFWFLLSIAIDRGKL